jgi:hypothetical protein
MNNALTLREENAALVARLAEAERVLRATVRDVEGSMKLRHGVRGSELDKARAYLASRQEDQG